MLGTGATSVSFLTLRLDRICLKKLHLLLCISSSVQLLPLEGFLGEEYWIVLAPLKLFCYPLLLTPLEQPEGLLMRS